MSCSTPRIPPVRSMAGVLWRTTPCLGKAQAEETAGLESSGSFPLYNQELDHACPAGSQAQGNLGH